MRRFFSWQLSALLLVGMAAGALDNSNQSSQSPDTPPDSTTPPDPSAAATTPATSTPTSASIATGRAHLHIDQGEDRFD